MEFNREIIMTDLNDAARYRMAIRNLAVTPYIARLKGEGYGSNFELCDKRECVF